MKKKSLLFFFITIFSCCSLINFKQPDKENIKVLFIGNSLTYSNDMPQLLQQMLNETKDNIKIFYRTAPGFSLKNHIKNQIETKSALSNKSLNELGLDNVLNKSWDYVILQEGTVRFLIPEVRKYNVESAILEIKSMLNQKCKIILFGTWVSGSSYPKQYCYPKLSIKNNGLDKEKYCSPMYLNSEEHIKAIKSAYKISSINTKTDFTNNGETFYSFSKQYPEIKLLDDDIHPSDVGAFLNACMFYKLLTNKNSIGLKFSGNIKERTSYKIKKFLSKQ